MTSYNRRAFIQSATIATVGTGLTLNAFSRELMHMYKFGAPAGSAGYMEQGRVGIIGLDTSHCVAFAQTLNDPNVKPELAGFKVVAAYPEGSKDIKVSINRRPKFTADIKAMGIEIVDSIDELLTKVDFVLLESNDGRVHLEQLMPILKAGKRVFVDKPMAASLADAVTMFKASQKYNIPIFSSSALRFTADIQSIANGELGKVIGADAYSPCTLEATHPDLFWYGIHGVEILYTLMGPGCKSVTRATTPDTDVVTGTWADNRIGVFRGLRGGKTDFGATAFCEKGIKTLPKYSGYEGLLIKILQYFRTGQVPVSPSETLEILAFMEAADKSKKHGGVSVDLQPIPVIM